MTSPQRILIAPDSFKGTLRAIDAARAIARGVRMALPDVEVDLCPIADGGEGTLDAFGAAISGSECTVHHAVVTGPLGRPVTARWLTIQHDGGRTAVVEMAQASGLTLIPEPDRDPTRTTTYGTGELIAAAYDSGCNEIIIGVGGSATCDGGCGAAQALGTRFFDSSHHEITQPLTGGDLPNMARIQHPTSQNRPEMRLRIGCDVINPLCGPNGSAAVYGPQKGATTAQVEALDRGLAHLASLVPQVNAEQPGMGAAGGIAFSLCALFNAAIESGIELILDTVNFDARLSKADFVITGEGSFDEQSFEGKAISGIAQRAARHGVPVAVIAGRSSRVFPERTIPMVQSVFSLVEHFGEDRAMNETAAYVQQAAVRVAAQA